MKSSIENVSRRTLLKGLAAGGGLMMCGGVPVFAQSPTKLLFMEPFDLALEYMHELNAIAGGHFAKEGLDVSVNNARGTAVGIQQVVAGQAFCTRAGMLDLMQASAAQEVPLLAVATSLQRGIFSVVSRSGDPINNPSELRGKTVGVASLGGGQEHNLNLLLATANIPAKEVPRQVIGSNAGNVELLKQGRVDAFLANVETVTILQRANEPIKVWSVSDFAPLPGGVIMTTRAFADKNPETIVKFVRAMRASALEILRADPGMILDRIAGKFELSVNKDRDFRLEVIKAYNAMTVSQGENNIMRNVPEVWQEAAKLVAAANIVKPADITALYTNKFVDEAR